jgi:rhodanese-related sulfurtransferase
MTIISPSDLYRKINAGEKHRLLDVRTPCEYARIHVPGALLRPLETFNPTLVASECQASSEPLYVLCQSGTRAKKAISQLEKAGAKQCVLVEGGTQAWVEAGLPAERQAAGGISLERQVRIAAGALVLAGTLLGVFWDPVFLFLPAFVGGGLVFAGITDICGMGMLLARMPWNQRPTKASAHSGAVCTNGGAE